MRPDESIVVSGGQTFTISGGGTFGFDVTGTISAGGSAQVMRLLPDGSSYVGVGSAVSSGGTPNYQNLTVPMGGYKLNVVSGSSIQGRLQRIPGE